MNRWYLHYQITRDPSGELTIYWLGDIGPDEGRGSLRPISNCWGPANVARWVNGGPPNGRFHRPIDPFIDAEFYTRVRDQAAHVAQYETGCEVAVVTAAGRAEAWALIDAVFGGRRRPPWTSARFEEDPEPAPVMSPVNLFSTFDE